jgi:hypothetical protein
MSLKKIQFDARWKWVGAVGLCLMLAVGAHASGVQSSADYLVTNESADGGGSRVSSADYASDGSFSGGDLAASADYVQRNGYVAALNNAPVALTNYTISLATNGTFKVQVGMVTADADGDAITYVSIQNPTAQNGSVTTDGKWVFYQPAHDYAGGDSFNFTVMDSEGDRAVGTILAQVIGPPVTVGPTLNLIGLALDNTPGSTAATLRFGGLPGATYKVQYASSLVPPILWTDVGTATVTNGTMTIVDPTAGSASQRYYRTVYQP